MRPAPETAVERVIADLETLNRSTEQDFLAVGGKLQEFRSVARQISSDMAALTELISGEHGGNASHALARMLEYSREMDTRTEQSGQALGTVQDLSCSIRKSFAGLRSTVSVFRTLCTLTRIETSRLGGAGSGFGDLADEVRPLSESIQSSGENILAAASLLDQGIQSALLSCSEIRARQLTELPSLLASVTSSLKSFEERRERVCEGSTRQAAQHKEICDAIDNLVTSIQFHDITRQQIQHVTDALRQLTSESAPGRLNRTTLPPNGQAILSLQSSQLSSAARVFASSTARIESDLETISGRVRDIAETSHALMGISGDEQNSFFLEMEGSFTAILKTVGTCATAQTQTQATAANLEESLVRMRQSVADIRGIEIQIQRIAINATIRATHIGAAGNALTVIAEVMQRLALDSNRNTEEVAEALDRMSDAARGVSGDSGHRACAIQPGPNGAIEEMRVALLELHSSSACSFSRVAQIAALGSRLGEDVGTLRSGFSAGRLFAEVVHRACGELERIGAHAGAAVLEGLEAAPVGGLEDFAKRYTMQAERDVHESMAGGSLAAPSTAIDESRVPVADGDLGDNVEFF
jgi:methyl-accepting chemotaxis protein